MTANCFHPGLVATGFNRNNGLLMDLGMTILKPVSRSPQKGADTLVWLATSPDVANVSGGYFIDQQQRPPSPEAEDKETAGGCGRSASGSARSRGEAPKPAHDLPSKAGDSGVASTVEGGSCAFQRVKAALPSSDWVSPLSCPCRRGLVVGQ